MKRIWVLLLALAVAQTAVIAQAGGERKGKHHNRGIANQLDLSDVQKQQVKTLREKMKPQLEALRADSSLSPQQKKEKMKQLNQARKTEMESILTKDQYAKWQQFREGRKNKQSRQAMAGQRKQRFEKMKQELNLTDAQIDKLKASNKPLNEKVKAIRTNTQLSKEQKMEQLKVVRQQRKQNMQNILTAEQRTKLKKLREKKPMIS